MAVCVLFLSETAANAQKRRTSRARRPAATKSAGNAAANSLALRQGSERVSGQVKALSDYIFLLGKSIALIDSVDKDKTLSTAAREQANAGKRGLIITITTFKNALTKMEEDFQASPALRPYLLRINAASDLASTAEGLAMRNDFDGAGRAMSEVLKRLTDVLQAMP